MNVDKYRYIYTMAAEMLNKNNPFGVATDIYIDLYSKEADNLSDREHSDLKNFYTNVVKAIREIDSEYAKHVSSAFSEMVRNSQRAE